MTRKIDLQRHYAKHSMSKGLRGIEQLKAFAAKARRGEVSDAEVIAELEHDDEAAPPRVTMNIVKSNRPPEAK